MFWILADLNFFVIYFTLVVLFKFFMRNLEINITGG